MTSMRQKEKKKKGDVSLLREDAPFLMQPQLSIHTMLEAGVSIEQTQTVGRVEFRAEAVPFPRTG